MAAQINEHNLRWLDNLTPRAAAQRRELRHKVARLIRTLPDASAPRGHKIPVDRDALLREVGLDAGAS